MSESYMSIAISRLNTLKMSAIPKYQIPKIDILAPTRRVLIGEARVIFNR